MNASQLLKSTKKKSKIYLSKYEKFSSSVVHAKPAAIFASGLTILLVGLFFLDGFFKNQNITLQTTPLNLSEKTALYPKLNGVLGATSFSDDNEASISALAAVIMDKDSKTIIYNKNGDLRFSMASTTKIMTALTALSYYKMNDVLTVYSPTVGSQVGFQIGEQATFENMLYGMMLPSGNDAALAIAQNYPGGESIFVEDMNKKAQALQLDNTHYSDPAGLDDNGDYTTPSDLARLAAYATDNAVLAQVVSTKERMISDITGRYQYDLHNLNILLGEDGVNGIKTGSTEEAGEVLVTSKVQDGHTLIIVVMKSGDRFGDTRQLLSLVSKLKYIQIHP